MSDAAERLITQFAIESNRIEGIYGARASEVEATRLFIEGPLPTIAAVEALASALAGGKGVVRARVGMDVQVGEHIPPRGGPHIVERLRALLASIEGAGPYNFHVAYETLHPLMDGNGRTGRALWAWQMVRPWLHAHARTMSETNPIPLPLDWRGLRLGFLHKFYYQALQASRFEWPSL